MFNMAATVEALTADTEEDVVRKYKKYGFIAKYREVDQYMTFLKGVFLRDVKGELCWVRLPSFLGKAFKIISNWRTLKYPRPFTDVQKINYMVYAQWLGYGKMDVNWFYTELGDIIKYRCKRILNDNLTDVKPDWLSKYHIIQTNETEICDEEWDAFMLHRYNITHDEQQGFLETLRSASDDTTMISHEGDFMEKLISVDY